MPSSAASATSVTSSLSLTTLFRSVGPVVLDPAADRALAQRRLDEPRLHQHRLDPERTRLVAQRVVDGLQRVLGAAVVARARPGELADRKSTRLNSSHLVSSYAVFCCVRDLRHLLSFPHDALPICRARRPRPGGRPRSCPAAS